MKFKKTKKGYCKSCGKHTGQKVTLVKTGAKRSSLKKGSMERAKKRGLGCGFGNKGIYGSKPAFSKFKRTGAKTSKKHVLKLTCKECKKSQLMTLPRAKKLELE